jgi:hypothetical protein
MCTQRISATLFFFFFFLSNKGAILCAFFKRGEQHKRQVIDHKGLSVFLGSWTVFFLLIRSWIYCFLFCFVLFLIIFYYYFGFLDGFISFLLRNLQVNTCISLNSYGVQYIYITVIHSNLPFSLFCKPSFKKLN